MSKVLNIAGAATTVVKAAPGNIKTITINKTVASGVITIYDNTIASGTKIMTITSPATLLQSYAHFPLGASGVEFVLGLTVVTTAADDITIVYD